MCSRRGEEVGRPACGYLKLRVGMWRGRGLPGEPAGGQRCAHLSRRTGGSSSDVMRTCGGATSLSPCAHALLAAVPITSALSNEVSRPCALVRPRSSRDGVGARLDGWIPRTPSRGLVAVVAELGSGGGTSGAYIVGVVGHSYLTILMPLWLIMPSYTSLTPAVLTVRHASTGKGVDLTCVRSAVRMQGIQPYLCQVGHTTAGAPILASDHLPASGADPTEHELGNLNGARADPTEQELGNWNGAGADPTEPVLGNLNDAGADPNEQELGNWNGSRADPTE
ncbi:hypothetical protein GW17_00014012 [Ensete ventricosum]|nr:hypothetical protein GW17_00014012 [Ensete ventricosum]